MEYVRLQLGQRGNKNSHKQTGSRSRIPKVVSFLLITFFPQLPLVVYLGYFQELIFPCDIVLRTLMLMVICSELVVGVGALSHFIRWQIDEFERECQQNQ